MKLFTKEYLFTQFYQAIKDQDWIVVAKVALQLNDLQFEMDCQKMENYYGQEPQSPAGKSGNFYGSIISVGNSSDQD